MYVDLTALRAARAALKAAATQLAACEMATIQIGDVIEYRHGTHVITAEVLEITRTGVLWVRGARSDRYRLEVSKVEAVWRPITLTGGA